MHYHIHIACLIALFLSMLIFLDDLHEDFILIDLKEIDLNLDSMAKEGGYVPISESIKQRVCEFKTENKTICSKEKKQTEACMEKIEVKLGKGGVRLGLEERRGREVKEHGGGGSANEGRAGEKEEGRGEEEQLEGEGHEEDGREAGRADHGDPEAGGRQRRGDQER